MSANICRSRLFTFLGVAGLVASFGSAGFGQRGTTSPLLPNRSLTPGDTLDVTKEDVCKPGYSKTVRDVPEEVKKQVYKSYGITSHQPHEYEVDHLISLELGGSNSTKNLWPQSYVTQPWNAHVKDKLENELHRLICDGKITMKTAQQDISSDWIAAYKKYFHTSTPLSAGTKSQSLSKDATSNDGSSNNDASSKSNTAATGKVWVNTDSGIYFLPGTRYFGKTRQGQYMTEAEARQKGYKPAK